MATWIIRGGAKSGEAIDDFLHSGCTGVGFRTDDYDLAGLNKAEIRRIIKRSCPAGRGEGKVTWCLTQIWNFIHSVRMGDEILMPVPGGSRVHVGVVESDYYHAGPDVWFPQRRLVRWTGETRPSPPEFARNDQRTVICPNSGGPGDNPK